MPIDTPVLIAGGGPVGMTLALSLARYGIRCTLVERNATTTGHPKMDITNARSMEIFATLGLTDRLRAAGVAPENPFDVAWITSLTGHELHRFAYPSPAEITARIAADTTGALPSQAPLRVSQIIIEPVLKAAIEAQPLIDARFATAYESLVQDETSVTATIRLPTGEEEKITCAYLAGCDGGGSRVRRDVGIALDGQLGVADSYMIHFRTTNRSLMRRWGIAWHYQNAAGTLIAQNDTDTYTLQLMLPPGADTSAMQPARLLEAWVGAPFEYEILQANPWSANMVVAKQYRAGRVLLAGDAAHQYMPTGGYGMNSGIADTAGLAWVLAANIQGWGGPGLLDAYEIERRAIARLCLQASTRHLNVRMEIAETYAQAGSLAGPGTEANRAAAAKKIAELGNAENESWGIEYGYRYEASPAVAEEPESPAFNPLTYTPSTTPGTRLPHIILADGTSIHDQIGLTLTLFTLTGSDPSPITQAAAALNIPLATFNLNRPDLRPRLTRNFLLIRPDQHIAWRGDSPPNDPTALLTHITGR